MGSHLWGSGQRPGIFFFSRRESLERTGVPWGWPGIGGEQGGRVPIERMRFEFRATNG